MTSIRTRKLGSNKLSDKYCLPTEVETTFGDLALFIANTGFSQIRIHPKKGLQTFWSIGEADRFYRETAVSCGFVFRSLEVAWRLVSQCLVSDKIDLWYILEDQQFILSIHGMVSTGIRRILDEEEEDPSLASPYHVTFRPSPVKISIDEFLGIHLRQTAVHGSSLGLFYAFSLMMPQYVRRHTLSRSRIANRRAKVQSEPDR